MKNWIVTRKADGATVYRYQSEEAVEWVDFPFADFDHAEEVIAPPPAEPQQDRHITKLAFRSRFTSAERAAITYAAKQASAQGAAVQSYLDDTQAATFIDLNRPDTRAGVQALEAAGLIAAGRAAQILDAEIQPQEVFNG